MSSGSSGVGTWTGASSGPDAGLRPWQGTTSVQRRRLAGPDRPACAQTRAAATPKCSTRASRSASLAHVRLLRLAIGLVVIVALVGEVGYRLLLQTEFVAAAAARDPQAQNVSASIGFPLMPGLVLHRTARVTVSEHQVALGSLKADALVARGTGVHFKILSSLTGRSADVTSVDRVDFSADISQAEASRTLPAGYSYVFQADRVIMKGPGTTLTGRFEVRAPAQVIFILPGLQTPPVLTFSGYPFSQCVTGVKVVAGKATITCSKPHPGTNLFAHP